MKCLSLWVSAMSRASIVQKVAGLECCADSAAPLQAPVVPSAPITTPRTPTFPAAPAVGAIPAGSNTPAAPEVAISESGGSNITVAPAVEDSEEDEEGRSTNAQAIIWGCAAAAAAASLAIAIGCLVTLRIKHAETRKLAETRRIQAQQQAAWERRLKSEVISSQLFLYHTKATSVVVLVAPPVFFTFQLYS